jgi:hypothetical protein
MKVDQAATGRAGGRICFQRHPLTTCFGVLGVFTMAVGDDQKTVDFFERYADSKAALFHQRESFAPSSKEFFNLAKLTRWVIYGTPSDEFKKANADFHPIYMTPFDGFVR